MFQLALSGEQTIYQAAELRAHLAQALQQHEHLQLELSTVAEIDCAIAQVLIWLYRECHRLHKPLELQNPSPPLQDFLALMGLTELLPLHPENVHGS